MSPKLVENFLTDFKITIEAVKNCCEFEQSVAGTLSASTALPDSTSLSPGQLDNTRKQVLIRWLNRRPDDVLKSFAILADSRFTIQQLITEKWKDYWTEIKQEFGPLAAEFPDTTIEGMTSRVEELRLLTTINKGS